ncbi:hypothetical protein IFM89_031940 [Coptis chinensis]|uniref:HSF-type DNA-binding domain-containing protein n=1 Tax=Coptis chinensis TaxID=261450 RepID=A0A835IRT4_9MAGN|nr:hypothetical protein IFM89_023770 [Coptis chinensis]KAF9622536.1 hypothetical protein IFM89_031940 [Coptis chinensis]
MANRSVPAPFLTKTYQLVSDPSSDDVISWNESGTAFVVWKSAEFARDLLPNYFKHNNFSSFVRQLNTYGFRKIVPNRWEFLHEFFKRGEIEHLSEIHRRKSTHALTPQVTQGGKSNGGPSSQSNSGDDMRSSSTTSPGTKNNASDDTTATTTTQMSNLSDENEKLRKDNEFLSTELARTKKQCEDLMAFLSKQANVKPDEINHIMLQGAEEFTHEEIMAIEDNDNDGDDNKDEDEADKDEEQEEEKCLKLFGVWLKGKKRECDDGILGGPPSKKMKQAMDYDAPWMKITPSSGEKQSLHLRTCVK